MYFRNEYDFLSNMHPCKKGMTFEGKTYSCAEAAFQASKSLNPEVRDFFTKLDGYTAKAKGKRIALRSDWNTVKVGIMKRILLAKFTQNPDLCEKLIATKDTPLVENNTWNDTFWGVCNGVGRNELGKSLEYVREILG